MSGGLSKVERDRRQIAIWLLGACLLVFSIVVLGGVTRLTGSGLSMVEWNPIFGWLPPLDQQAWEKVFALYQASPEFIHKNYWMELSDFKTIYWFEYAHRVLARLIGVYFLIPFLWFLVRGKVERWLAPRLVGAFALGGLQGVLGWYMVKSGLVDVPEVSQYRLVAHLGLAFVIYGYMLWIALDLLRPRRGPHPTLRWLWRASFAVTLLLCVTIASGGFVAGLKAGYVYNTFPLMADQLVPSGLLAGEPGGWRNLVENRMTVQFTHRVLATVTFLALCWLWLVSRRQPVPPGGPRRAFALVAALAVLQVALGISTLVLHVPVALASAHQAGALALLTVLLYLLHQLRAAPPRSG